MNHHTQGLPSGLSHAQSIQVWTPPLGLILCAPHSVRPTLCAPHTLRPTQCTSHSVHFTLLCAAHSEPHTLCTPNFYAPHTLCTPNFYAPHTLCAPHSVHPTVGQRALRQCCPPDVSGRTWKGTDEPHGLGRSGSQPSGAAVDT